MADATQLNFRFNATVRYTVDDQTDASENPILLLNQFNSFGTRNASSTVPVTKTYADTVALVAGAKTLDFTSLTSPGGAALDCTGLKLQLMLVQNTAANNSLRISIGAANPYDFMGAATGDITLLSSATEAGRFMQYFPDTLENVDATHKTIDFAGTLVEEFDIMLVFG